MYVTRVHFSGGACQEAHPDFRGRQDFLQYLKQVNVVPKWSRLYLFAVAQGVSILATEIICLDILSFQWSNKNIGLVSFNIFFFQIIIIDVKINYLAKK